jgi:ketosteroid isomerase-like protein
MSESRAVMDRLTSAVLIAKDLKSAADCFADDAVAVTPDRGEISGREHIIEYMRQFVDAFPDVRYESVRKHQAGNAAIDEGRYVGTNTGPLVQDADETLPATGRRIHIPTCEVAIVDGDLIREYRFYYDQMDFLRQLGLMEGSPPADEGATNAADALRTLLPALYASFGSGDATAWTAHLADDVVVIGTDPDEWWEGQDLVARMAATQLQEMSAAGVQMTAGTPRIVGHGDVAWAVDSPTLQLPDGTATPLRVTLIATLDPDGALRIRHGHYSVGAVNEEVFGQQLTTT